MKTTPLGAQLIADYFLASVDCEGGDNVTNLKLQKLLYYAQGYHVAMHAGEPLFREALVAWKHGPVVTRIYHEYKKYGWQAIEPPKHFDVSEYPPEVRELLDAVYKIYGQFTATTLETMTHDEPPWKNASRNRIIALDALGEFFSKLIEAGRKGRGVAGHPAWPKNSFAFQRRKNISERFASHREKLRAIARTIKG